MANYVLGPGRKIQTNTYKPKQCTFLPKVDYLFAKSYVAMMRATFIPYINHRFV